MTTDYIPHCILRINHQIERDPLLVEIMRLVFEWANKEGLAGKRVYNLKLEEPDPNDPLALSYGLHCMVECTEEQRKIWEMNRENQIRAYLGVGPKDGEGK